MIIITKISHLSRFPRSVMVTYKALCIQHEASIAAVWPENSRKLTFLLQFFRKGQRQLIAITHSQKSAPKRWLLDRVCMQMT